MTRAPRIGRAPVAQAPAHAVGTGFARHPGILMRVSAVLLLALVSLLPLACGTSKGASPDGASGNGDGASGNGDGPPGNGQPVSCVQGGPSGTGVACNSTFVPATCVGNQCTCPKGTVDQRDCTCGEPGLSCLPQICTEHGPICLDAGVDADGSVDAGDVKLDQSGADAPCDVGCTPATTASFCQANEVQWTCQGAGYADALFRSACRDPGTNLPRFCCPPSFLAQCR
jgi:hypothetical protein